ncbi:Hypothetical predicted protein [Cloeon dipterum]|uniref:RING-type domain-containing protein n=1 Tax=Cloeon dipterum TaxID=197152 RepID=A0A8S1BY41_9INSE|nr:Hypothetical predicted protein [Cloeon dipterum]
MSPAWDLPYLVFVSYSQITKENALQAGNEIGSGWKNSCLRCQSESQKQESQKQDCVVVWGDCNHSFHYCCMSLWVKQNNRCPLCQQEWGIQRLGQ